MVLKFGSLSYIPKVGTDATGVAAKNGVKVNVNVDTIEIAVIFE